MPYRYGGPQFCYEDVSGLMTDQVWNLLLLFLFFHIVLFYLCLTYLIIQVTWAPWTELNGLLGFEVARLVSQTRRLLKHEYDFAFYLGERLIRQHSPGVPLVTPSFHLVTMCRPNDIPVDDRQTLIRWIHYMSFILNMPY